jgi:putative flippase GtrA
VSRLVAVVRRLWRELLGFGVVGAVGYASDAIVLNVLYQRVPSVLASAIAVSISTLVAYAGNRFWTFRKRERRETRAEFGLFVVVSAGGFLITVGCVAFTEHVLGLDSRLAVNIAQLGAGQVLGTLFRFWACHTYVFPEQTGGAEPAPSRPAGRSGTEYQGSESDSLLRR